MRVAGRVVPHAPLAPACHPRASRAFAPRLADPPGGSRLASSAPRAVVAMASAASAPPPASPDDLDAVRAYVRGGPLFTQLGLSDEELTDARVATWASLASRLRAQLHLSPDGPLDDAAASRVYHYYLPVHLWCVARLDAHRARVADAAPDAFPSPPPLVVGVSAPQGCGKTTVVAQLQRLLSSVGVAAASISIDDVYLTGAEQDVLAAANPENALLRFRGNAGSHDVALGLDVIRALRGVNDASDDEREEERRDDESGGVAVPRYDKTLRGGRGDRAPRDTWPTIRPPLDVVLLEGWMLGFRPVGPVAAAAASPDLVAVDDALREGGYDALHAEVDEWMVVKVADAEWVRAWRLEAERAARDEGKPTLTDAEVSDFVDRFMPAYRAYLPRLYRDGPAENGWGEALVMEVDASRRVVGGR